MANANLKRYLAQTAKLVEPKKARRTEILQKQPPQEAPALPHLYEALWDAPEPEVVTDAEGEPEPGTPDATCTPPETDIRQCHTTTKRHKRKINPRNTAINNNT